VKRALVLAAATALLVAGCGGGSGKRLTKAELISQGDVICTRYREKNKALQNQAPALDPLNSSAADLRKIGRVLPKVADNIRGARSELSKLNPPQDVASDWKNTLDDLGSIASRLGDAANAAEHVDRQRLVTDYGEIGRLNRRIGGFETDYGFRVCGRTA
jgi:hypothetical protein